MSDLYAHDGVGYGHYRRVKQMVENDVDCSRENPLCAMVNQTGIGEYLAPASPNRFYSIENLDAMAAPILGQHTDEILAQDLGLSGSQIGVLHDNQTVA